MILNDICEVYSGYALKKFNKNGDGLPVIKIGNILADGTLQLEDCEYTTEKVHDKYYSKKEDIYVALSGATTGKIGINKSEKKYIINQRVGIVRKKDNNIPNEFIKFFLLRQTERILQEAAGCAQPNISPKQIAQYALPDIRSEKMRQIVVVLNRLTSVIVSRKTELQKLDDLIKARFVEMFGDPEINSKGWKKEPLKDHATVFVGYPFPSEGYTSEGIDIVGGYNLMQGHILWDESKRWPDVAGYEQYLLRANDIVMAMDRPWVNGGFKIARIDASHLPALLIQRTACIRGKDLEQEFLHSLLDTQRFAKHCNITGSLVPHISNKDINSYQVIVPPTEEQRRFTAFVAQVDKSKLILQKSLHETQMLFDKLMQQYFD